ncbi:hypothetical protein [Bacillus yapensis]|uniref:hypothetical protein n=1 Tax=Bacillus yapensis TaxID=2492960 RepID=UPI00148501A1|nr:hypothetical protein [Bacillus yapensis]
MRVSLGTLFFVSEGIHNPRSEPPYFKKANYGTSIKRLIKNATSPMGWRVQVES